jgi:bis(5'-nucleosyl)-tetraphosphatase (symmetrical)
MALHVQGWLMVHAGVLPQWTTERTLALAAEVEQALRGAQAVEFLSTMYGNTPASWDDSLTGHDRLRVIVNALTRLRFCTPEGEMEFKAKGSADAMPLGFMPWFNVPGRLTVDTPIAFGHWSTVGLDAPEGKPIVRNNTLALDTGCVWGNCLTAAKLIEVKGDAPGAFELFSVDCKAMQAHD